MQYQTISSRNRNQIAQKAMQKGYQDGLRAGVKVNQSTDREAYLAVNNLHTQTGGIGMRYSIMVEPENFTNPQFRLEFAKLWQSWKQVVADHPIIKAEYNYWINQINNAFNLIAHIKDYRKMPIAWRSLKDALYALSGELTRSADSTIWGLVQEAANAIGGLLQSVRKGENTRAQMNRALSVLGKASQTGGFFGSRLFETVAFLASLKTPEQLREHTEELTNIRAYLDKVAKMHTVHGLNY